MFLVEGRDVLYDWLTSESDPDKRLLMLEWFAGFVQDPVAGAHRVPGISAPVYLVVTPVRDVFLKFLYAWHFNTVKLIEFGTLP